MGWGRNGFTDLEEGREPGFRREMRGFRHFDCFGSRWERPSTRQRIEQLEETQRDLEEMTADVASHLQWLRQRESEQATT